MSNETTSTPLPPGRESAGGPANSRVRGLIAVASVCAIVLAVGTLVVRLAPRPAPSVQHIAGTTDAAQPFLDAIKKKQFDAAYALTSTSWQHRMSSQDFANFARDALKPVHSFNHIALMAQDSSTSGTGTVTVSYFLTGPRSTERVALVLVREGSGYKVDSAAFAPQ